MKLWQQLALDSGADFMGPGAMGIAVPTKRVSADSSASDVAHHHSWTDASSTDVERRRWELEGYGRNPLFGSPGCDSYLRKTGRAAVANH